MAKSTYSAFKTDENLEQKGILLDLGEVGKFRIARAGGANALFQKRLTAVTKPHRRAIQTGNIEPEVADALLAQVYAETVLLGWEGVTGPDSQPISFSKDAAIQLFTDLPDLFKEIRQTAEDMTYFRAELLEGDAKN